MSAATPPTSSDPGEKKAAPAKKKRHDPEDYRMSIGDHLEELRNRLFLGAVGFVVACIICFIFGEHVTRWFIKPFIDACDANDINPQMYTREVAESFMTYIKIVMISAATIAGPWLLYQVWQFIAAGLYPKERKYITKYLPLSITLLISGMVFLYFYVLPLMLQFFLAFTLGDVMRRSHPYPPTTNPTTRSSVMLHVLKEDPKDPEAGAMWIDAQTGMLKVSPGAGKIRVVPYGSNALVSPQITMADYIDMVVGLLLSFGLSFQMPLVVLALHKIGIMDIPTLKKWRRVVYFAMSIIAACIVPDVATGMIALLIPLILLYELGILLAQWSDRKAKEQEAV
jgi:Sec-independent protein secretion pathway component TatC